jgi:hypothetical protein
VKVGTGVGTALISGVLALGPVPLAGVPRLPVRATPAAPSGADVATAMPVVRQQSYRVDARVRPLLLFWVGRSDVGYARLTWRQTAAGDRGLEFLIGSDPTRAPRNINRWGFIQEILGIDRAEILGVMRDSGEQTLEEADASTANQSEGTALFRVSRSTITNNTAVGGTMTLHAPTRLTYRELDELLALIPAAPSSVGMLALPSGTERGFLAALENLMVRSLEPCRRPRGAQSVAAETYVYNQRLYGLSLESCEYVAKRRSRVGVFTDIVDGRFEVRNRTTGNETHFSLAYGASGDRRGVPVRAVFRPHWWIEVELLLGDSAGVHDGREPLVPVDMPQGRGR